MWLKYFSNSGSGTFARYPRVGSFFTPKSWQQRAMMACAIQADTRVLR